MPDYRKIQSKVAYVMGKLGNDIPDGDLVRGVLDNFYYAYFVDLPDGRRAIPLDVFREFPAATTIVSARKKLQREMNKSPVTEPDTTPRPQFPYKD